MRIPKYLDRKINNSLSAKVNIKGVPLSDIFCATFVAQIVSWTFSDVIGDRGVFVDLLVYAICCLVACVSRKFLPKKYFLMLFRKLIGLRKRKLELRY